MYFMQIITIKIIHWKSTGKIDMYIYDEVKNGFNNFQSCICSSLPLASSRHLPSKHIHFHSIYNLFIKLIFMDHKNTSTYQNNENVLRLTTCETNQKLIFRLFYCRLHFKIMQLSIINALDITQTFDERIKWDFLSFRN